MSRRKDAGPHRRRRFVKTFVVSSGIFPEGCVGGEEELFKGIPMRWLAGWIFGVVVLGSAGHIFGEEPKSGPPATLNQLSMEVSALQILHHLNVTTPQLTALRKIAKGAAPNSQDAKPGKGSEKLRAALLEMHKALLDKKEAERIDSLADKLNGLRDDEKQDL